MLFLAICSTVSSVVKSWLAAVTRPNLGFALRTTAASFIALYLALLIGLDDPKWAPMTVWIVAQGNRGMSISKGQWRFLGTLIGAGVGIAILTLFVRNPVLAMVVLAIWVGLCTSLSTGLRNFRSYGAVLAGYSAAVVAMDSVGDPAHILNIALSRVAYIGLGILVEAVMALLFTSEDPLGTTRKRLFDFLRQASRLSATALTDEVGSDAVRKLFVAALGVETAAEFAAATSGQLRRRLGHLRMAMVAALQQVATARELKFQLAGQALQHDPLVTDAAALLDRVSATDAAPDSAAVDALANRLDAALAREIATAQETVKETVQQTAHSALRARLLMLFRLRDLIGHLARGIARATQIDRPDAPRSRLRFSFHFDRTAAIHNGIRAATATIIAASVWLSTGWIVGPVFVIIVAVIAALFATRPDPVASSFGFLKGTFIAVVVATLFKFVVVPDLAGIVPMLVIVAAVMIPAGIAMQHPPTAGSAAIFSIFFLDAVGIDSTPVDPRLFFDGMIALLGGMLMATAVFKVVLPVNAMAVRERLHHAIRSDLAAIGRHTGRWSVEAWFSRTADRVERQVITGARIPPDQAERELREVLAMLSLGSAAIRLHRLGLSDPAMRRPIAAVLRALAALDPAHLARTARRSSARLARQATTSEASAMRLLQAAALLRDVMEAAEAHAAFLKPGTGVTRADDPRQAAVDVDPLPDVSQRTVESVP